MYMNRGISLLGEAHDMVMAQACNAGEAEGGEARGRRRRRRKKRSTAAGEEAREVADAREGGSAAQQEEEEEPAGRQVGCSPMPLGVY